jgi:hypothetical protein
MLAGDRTPFLTAVGIIFLALSPKSFFCRSR